MKGGMDRGRDKGRDRGRYRVWNIGRDESREVFRGRIERGSNISFYSPLKAMLKQL
jgi:hypothetical protein